jgi:CRISPR-associated protein Cmr5
MQTMQQKRAAFALGRVQDLIKRLDEKQKKELKSRASALPFMIHANGLGQAAAFYCSKDAAKPREKTYKDLYTLLSDWLTQDEMPFSKCANLLAGITAANQHIYLAAQAEAMLFMDWVKKFTNAFIQENNADEPATV